jgi:hypothetical protein
MRGRARDVGKFKAIPFVANQLTDKFALVNQFATSRVKRTFFKPVVSVLVFANLYL